ncbi:uncharacterized protein LOC134565387 [Prinia subflava]|uniref:uncharacterized protein LOC134565387 n=1 Tax=Prinia subflava TaxID=208062 RepID=UPI002FE2BA17
MDIRELLKAQVDAVATLGELAATVTVPPRRAWPLLYQRSLCEDLRRFTWNLYDTLDHSDVASLGEPVTTLRATLWDTQADVRPALGAWRGLVDALEDSWFWLVEEAADLLDNWEDAAKDTAKATAETTVKATTEATAKATIPAQAGDLQDKTASQGTAGDDLVATAQQLPLSRAEKKAALLVAAHEARVAAATKAMEEATNRLSDTGAATRRGQRAKVARGLLGRLVVMCDRASLLPLELQDRLEDIEATLEGTREVTSHVLKVLEAVVAEIEQLWEASARLTTRHLLGTLQDIHDLLWNPDVGSGGPRDPRGRAVAERCQNAIEDIPRLLRGH